MEIGTKAPEFVGTDENGKEVSLNDFKGHKLVLYFYPKDSTPGCTAEACDLRDNYHRYLSLGYQVLGVSKDSPASHRKFIEKYSLPFHLISDPDCVILCQSIADTDIRVARIVLISVRAEQGKGDFCSGFGL